MAAGTHYSVLSSVPKHEDWLPVHVEQRLEKLATYCRLQEQGFVASELQGVIQLVREMNQHRLDAEQRASLG